MKYIGLLLACLAIILPGSVQGEVYRWVDRAGKVHYSDTPPPANIHDVERKKLSAPVTLNEDIPYEAQRAQQNFPVTLYVTSGCGTPCDQARSLLNKRGVPFTEKSLNTQEEIDSFFKMSGSNGAPTLAVGKAYLSGFIEARWNKELDAAGYPKTASYRQRIAEPPQPSAPQKASSGAQSAPEAPAVPEGQSVGEQAAPGKTAE